MKLWWLTSSFLALLLFAVPQTFAADSHHHEGENQHRHDVKVNELHPGEHDHAPFSASFGLSMSRTFRNNSDEGGTEVSGLSLSGHDGHDHGSSGESESHGSASTESIASIGAAYKVTERVSLGFSGGASPEHGPGDPVLGVSTYAKLGNVRGNVRASAAIPASEESRESGRVSTFTISAGPSTQIDRWSFGASSTATRTQYRQTENDAHLEEDEGTHADGGVEEADHGHTKELGHYAQAVGIGYEFSSRWRADSSFGIARIVHEQEDPRWVTSVTLAQVGYSVEQLTAAATLALASADDSIKTPKTPTVGVGLEYVYE